MVLVIQQVLQSRIRVIYQVGGTVKLVAVVTSPANAPAGDQEDL
jgi:hypothetical protein